MSQPARGLGKGLGAILGGGVPTADELRRPAAADSAQARPRPADIISVPVSEIEPNPYQPRQSFDQEELDGLAASIKSLGLITPITVRRTAPRRYQIISGERRFRACQMAGLEFIPSYVRDSDDRGMLEMAIVENIQRSDLDPIEVAQSYRRLMDECELTQEEMAERIGKSRPSVANTLRLLNLPAKVQHDLKLGLLSVGHAKVLLGVADPGMQVKLCDLTIKNSLNVRQLEQKVKALKEAETQENAPVVAAAPQDGIPSVHKELCREMSRFFKGEIKLRRGSDGRGSLKINFSSDEEVKALLDALGKTN